MKLNEIQELIKFVAKAGVSEVELETEGIKIVIKTSDPKRRGKGSVEPASTIVQAPIPMQGVTGLPAQVMVESAPAAPVAPATPAVKAGEESEDANEQYVTIKSPMIGTFYRKPSPDKPLFVEVGDDVSEGQTVCIIEAMKLFNEIESEISGKIVKILVEDNSPVEYDQPLFLLDPK